MSSRRRLPLHVDGIRDVAERQLCTGCGVCAHVQAGDITMVDDLDAGRRPVVRQVDSVDVDTDRALAACPGVGLAHGDPPEGIDRRAASTWGPVLEVWEGHAGDPEVRFAGSSGGAATALALHGMQYHGMHGTLHIRARDDAPLLNETVLSTDRGQLLAATGSRYAPASPCDGLELLRRAPAPSVFIGKPCDVAATARVRKDDPVLDEKLGLTIAVFCGGTPSTRGTHELLRTMGIDDPDDVDSFRYRGNGWPGKARAVATVDGTSITREATYDESWNTVLQRHRQWRCYVCADHTGEFADIAVGDPWYQSDDDNPGSSLVVVRTERGRRHLAAAIAAGDMVATRVSSDRIRDAQPGLLKIRGAVWGRLLASRLAGIPAPVYRGLPMVQVWLRELGWRAKLRSIVGLFRRMKRKGLRSRHPVQPLGPPSSSHRSDR